MPYPAHEPHLTRMPSSADADGHREAETRTAAASTDGGKACGARRRFLIIHNPIAGRNRVGLVHDVVRRLGQAGAIADVMSLSESETEENFAARIGTYDAIVASGGDGTARSIASLLQGQETPFALIPAGTGNVLAAELDLPRDAGAIAHMLLHGPLVRLTIGAVNGSPFLLMFGAGFDGQVIARLPLALKRRVGRLAFGWPVIAALAQKPRFFPATIDGQEHDASWLVVANASRYGSHFVLSPRTNILSPGFNVVISRATSRRQRLWELVHIMVGRLERVGTIEMRPARDIEIRHAEGLPVQVDGERLASSSYRIEAEVSGASMIVPATRSVSSMAGE
jgi:diacylglycerol kinase (ATP)